MAKRIYLLERKQVGPVEYSAAGFYQNVPDELADKWVNDRLAHYATEDNVVVPWPEPVDESGDVPNEDTIAASREPEHAEFRSFDDSTALVDDMHKEDR